MASNDPSPEDTHEEKSLLGPHDTETIQVSMTTETDTSEKDSAVTMTTEDTLTDDINDDRIDDMTRRYVLLKLKLTKKRWRKMFLKKKFLDNLISFHAKFEQSHKETLYHKTNKKWRPETFAVLNYPKTLTVSFYYAHMSRLMTKPTK